MKILTPFFFHKKCNVCEIFSIVQSSFQQQQQNTIRYDTINNEQQQQNKHNSIYYIYAKNKREGVVNYMMKITSNI